MLSSDWTCTKLAWLYEAEMSSTNHAVLVKFCIEKQSVYAFQYLTDDLMLIWLAHYAPQVSATRIQK